MLSAKKSAAPSDDTLYIEDVFSTHLYTGNGSTLTITNGIDLSTKGGLVWFKERSPNAYTHSLFDTARGATYRLDTSTTGAQASNGGTIAFNATGFTTPNNESTSSRSGENYASWTFRKAPEFFDVVTYTGTGVARTISHNLGVAPGIIITKRTDVAGDDWATYHRSLGASSYISLNTTGASQATSTGWNDTAPTSTGFSLGTSSLANANGGSYVAYLFAHDTTSTGMIQCDSFTTDGGGNATVSLGWEPQWLLVKKSGSTSGGVDDRWHIYDTMRGIPVGAVEQVLDPNNTNAEYTTNWLEINATGFSAVNYNLTASKTYIYLAIRRGPMKTPTTGTQVYNAVAYSGNG
ncbi:MAG: hypothetical protein FJX55_03600, partial [Alphaproteobacteria bacterium]|nr:hypothetical protein [Alphaproteobacteria bacterium]